MTGKKRDCLACGYYESGACTAKNCQAYEGGAIGCTWFWRVRG